jgi:hypothetical protein
MASSANDDRPAHPRVVTHLQRSPQCHPCGMGFEAMIHDATLL